MQREIPPGKEPPSELSRRRMLGGAVGMLVALMVRGAPLARAAQQDPRLALANRLCDLVIPETDTPGGSKAGAGAFVLLAIDHRMNALDDAAWLAVREHLDAAAGGDFLKLPLERQSHLLESLDSRAFAQPQSPPPSPASPSPTTLISAAPGASSAGAAELAWQRLKPAIIAGYYTSQIGASQELVYEPVPGPERRNFTLTADYRARSNEGFGGAL